MLEKEKRKDTGGAAVQGGKTDGCWVDFRWGVGVGDGEVERWKGDGGGWEGGREGDGEYSSGGKRAERGGACLWKMRNWNDLCIS